MNRRTLLRAILAQGALSKTSLAAAWAGEPVNPTPLLQLRADVRSDRLLIDYAVENPARTDIYLEARYYLDNIEARHAELDRRILVSPGIEFSAKDGLAIVHRLPNMRLPLRAAPLLTLVHAGTRFSETIELPLPLRENERPASCRDKPSTLRGLRFDIDYLWSLQGLNMQHFKIGNEEVEQPIFPPTFVSLRHTLTRAIVPLAIPVIECAEL